MVKKVLKFGGTSVGSIERIQHVANIIKKECDEGNQIIAIVSAMSGKTNELLDLSKQISKKLALFFFYIKMFNNIFSNVFNPNRIKHMKRFKFSINIPPFVG